MATHLYPKYSTFNPLTTNAESYSNLPESFTTDYSNFSMSIKLFYLREKKPVDALSCTGIWYINQINPERVNEEIREIWKSTRRGL